MRYSKKPKYRLDKRKVGESKDKKVLPEDIYREMLIDKIKKRRKR